MIILHCEVIRAFLLRMISWRLDQFALWVKLLQNLLTWEWLCQPVQLCCCVISTSFHCYSARFVRLAVGFRSTKPDLVAWARLEVARLLVLVWIKLALGSQMVTTACLEWQIRWAGILNICGRAHVCQCILRHHSVWVLLACIALLLVIDLTVPSRLFSENLTSS